MSDRAAALSVESSEDLEAPLGAAVMRLLARARGGEAPPADLARTAARRLAEEGARLLPDSSSAILVAGPSERSFTVLATSGGAVSSLEGQSWPRRGTIMQRAIEGQSAVESPAADELTALGPPLHEAGVRSVRAVPLLAGPDGRAGGRGVVGVYLSMRSGSAAFNEHQRRLLDAYATLVAMVIRSNERHAAEMAEARRMALGVDVALDLASALSPGEVNHRILVRTTEAVSADRATLVRLHGDQLVVDDFYDREGRPGVTGVHSAVRNHPVIVRALTTRRVERSQGVALELPNAPSAWAETQHSAVLPLLFGGEVIGFLNLHRRNPEPFSDEDIVTMQLIANLAVLALRNARLYADAQDAKAAMSEFLDVVVHDLRSPLTVVGGYCNMMSDGTFGAPQESWSRPLEIVQTKVREAQRLVDQLLQAARLDTGALPSHDEDVDLCKLAREAVSRAEPQAHLQGAHLSTKVPREPVWASGDRANLEQIVDNLVNNAIAYGGAPAEVEISVTDHEHPNIAVRDHGPGIPADKRERIFDRFYRGHEGVQGTGLGLYVSRRLAGASHGTLELDTSWTDGSRFVLSLQPARK